MINVQNVSTAKRRTLDFKRLFQAQLIVTALIMALAGGVSGSQAALSALMGGVVSILPGIYFVWRGLRRTGRQSKQNVLNFYQAAAGKFGLTVALFVIVLVSVPPSNPAFFFVAYVVAQLMYWLAPWLVRERSTP
ncbi:ATP synthase subunit I [Halomonas sp. GFAJ-1]|uniref:ATP synthase subunit I n=1 Tax=Halomonas sp. GFAJ-1 TaxID=1118153 RepID=UPI00023A5995|nr:ATP synthase subunit I [Halomonas sp. GFAJ-1]AVI61922.1 F0F1 ATP synthase assembly protein I [Halomonas sp. GFAJ-1]EHK61097.1 ATP synthase protein I [Halomonas sp. GFAJ-1]